MRPERLSFATRGRVNPLVPAAVSLGGLIALAIGYRWIGGGLVAGSLLAYINGALLSRRVDVAAQSGNIGVALIIMQAGLVITLIAVALLTLFLIQFSSALALGAAAGFAITQIASLAAFYFQQARYIDGPVGTGDAGRAGTPELQIQDAGRAGTPELQSPVAPNGKAS